MNQAERRALILTALPVEYAAIRAHLADLREEEDAVGTVYEVGTFGSGESQWNVCLSEVGAGNVAAATLVERSLVHFRPTVAFFVGVAGGIKDVAIGDVVVATKVYGYESGKEEMRGFLPRPGVGASAYRLIQRARAEARKDLWRIIPGQVTISSEHSVFVGPIAAGEKVVASARSQTAKFLKNHYDDALAVEMEGAGFLSALHAHTDTAALVIRGISDLLSGKRGADRAGSQHIASRNAAAFAMAVLAGLGTAPGAYELSSVEKRKRVFISYSNDSSEHQDRVSELANQLRADGIDCRIDLFERTTPSVGWPLWMEQQISEADVVLAVCSEKFSRRFSGEDASDAGLGAAWESQLTYQMLQPELSDLRRFVPILFEDGNPRDVPMPLRALSTMQLPAYYEALLRRLATEPDVAPVPTVPVQEIQPPREVKDSGKPATERPPVKVFVSYSHRDEIFREELSNHLAVLRRQGIIELWHDRKISPGSGWEREVDAALTEANIVLLLVSSDFLASDYCYGVEMRQALERDRSGQTRVVPIIVRPCYWKSAPIGSLQVLPRDARPVSTWGNVDDAWLDIARALRTLATRESPKTTKEEMLPHEPEVATQPPPVVSPIEIIFPRGAMPELNYVEPNKFNYLKIYLRDPNGGVIVEGPSGIGKTTATQKALNQLGVEEGSKRWLNAGRAEDVENLRQVLDAPPGGIVVVDDFHHLAFDVKAQTARAIKCSCEGMGGPKTKFVLVGINKVGYALLDSFPDLHGRVVTFSMVRQPDEKIEEMISLGEKAANIRFVRKKEITREASGSFFMAQQLCFFVAMAAGVEQTQTALIEIQKSVVDITPDILEYQRLKFHKPVAEFASFDRGVAERGACLALLYRIAFDSEGCVLVQDVRRQYPNLDGSFAWLEEDDASHHDTASILLAGLFHFDPTAGVFSVEDPQLQFYLKHLEWTALAKQVGLKAKITPDNWLHIGVS